MGDARGLSCKQGAGKRGSDEDIEDVFIVGGPKAVSSAVEESVRTLNGGTAVERVWGENRYETALEVMGRAAGLRPAGIVFVATGKGYSDAIAASPLSYALGAPTVLVDPAKEITAAQLEAIAASGVDHVVVLGGPAAVPNSIESQLRAAGIADVSRIAGATRYETAVEVARWAADNGADLSAPVVATGLKDADALAGAALAGRSGSVLLLADDEGAGGEAAPALDFLSEHAAEVHEGYILGGKNAISEALADRILAAANGVMTP